MVGDIAFVPIEVLLVTLIIHQLLSEREKRATKRIARALLTTISREKLVLDWRKRQQSRAAVRVAIEDVIWQLPKCFTKEMCQQKSARVYQHVYDNYWGAGQSVYAVVG